MSDTNDFVKQSGEVEIIVDHKNGKQNRFLVKNAILTNAKNAHANALCNNIGQTFQYYVSNMIFGTNGTLNGAPKVVDGSRNGLFGPTLVNKQVISIVNPQVLNQAIFTAVIGFDEGNSNVINEMALMMKNGELYSMVTLGGISKDSTIQLTINWRITWV
jgi:serine acetyltransferase